MFRIECGDQMNNSERNKKREANTIKQCTNSNNRLLLWTGSGKNLNIRSKTCTYMQFIVHTEPQEPALIFLSVSQQPTRFFLSCIGNTTSLNFFEIATKNIRFYCTPKTTFTFLNFQLNRSSSASHTYTRTRIWVIKSQIGCVPFVYTLFLLFSLVRQMVCSISARADSLAHVFSFAR